MLRQNRFGFTLVELLVVIAIIGVLVALLLPAVQQAREAARRMQCTNNLRQVGLACHNYHDTFRSFPPGRLVYNGTDSSGGSTKVVTGFLAMILPFVEQGNLGDIYKQEYGFDDPANQTAVNTPIDSYLCPSSPGDHVMPIYAGWNMGWTTDPSQIDMSITGVASDYQGVRGVHYAQQSDGSHIWDGTCGILNQDGTRFRDITDGTSNTILLFEKAGMPNHWKDGKQQGSPTNAQFYQYGPWAGNNGVGIFNWSDDSTSDQCDNCYRFINVDNEGSPYSFHPGICNIMLADGSTRNVKETVESQTFVNLCNKADGNVLGEY